MIDKRYQYDSWNWLASSSNLQSTVQSIREPYRRTSTEDAASVLPFIASNINLFDLNRFSAIFGQNSVLLVAVSMWIYCGSLWEAI